jgi:hypothetical protein
MALSDRARAIGRSAVSPRSSFMQVLGGGITYYGHKLGSENIDFIRNNFWAGPAVGAVLGHILKRSPQLREVGAAMIGASGYALALGYTFNEQSKKSSQPAQTSGVVEVGEIPRRQLPGTLATSFAPELSGHYPQTGAYGSDYDDDVSEAMQIGR